MSDVLEDSGSSSEMVGGCCVCSDEHGWDENPLVYCDGKKCYVAVHQACYGIVTVPPGPWFCRKCESGDPIDQIKCEFCPSRTGAMKHTDNKGWAHVICSLYIPEVRFGNVSTMEPIIVSLVPKERYSRSCYLCELRSDESHCDGIDRAVDSAEIRNTVATSGACMSCNKVGCKQSFHVTCAQAAGLLCEEAGNNEGNVKYCGYCEYHYQRINKKVVKTIPAYRHPKPKNIDLADVNHVIVAPSADSLLGPPTPADRQRRRSSVDVAHFQDSAARRSEVILAERAGSIDDSYSNRDQVNSVRSVSFSAKSSSNAQMNTNQSQSSNKVVLKLSKQENGIYCTTPPPPPHNTQSNSVQSPVDKSLSTRQSPEHGLDNECNGVSVPTDVSPTDHHPLENQVISQSDNTNTCSPIQRPNQLSPVCLSPSDAIKSDSPKSLENGSVRDVAESTTSKRIAGPGKRLGRPPKKGTHIAQSAVPKLIHENEVEKSRSNVCHSGDKTVRNNDVKTEDTESCVVATVTSDICGVKKRIGALAKASANEKSGAPVWMLGASINCDSPMAKEMEACLRDEVLTANAALCNHSSKLIPSESTQASQNTYLVGVPFSNAVENEEHGLRDNANDSTDGDPQSLDALLRIQWEMGSNFLMEHAANTGLSGRLSELHSLQLSNRLLVDSIGEMEAMCDHLTALNSRMSMSMLNR